MNTNERFGQIETMLAEMLRRMDRQSEQIGDIIGILKTSDERQSRAEERQTRAEERQVRAEERQDLALAEIKRLSDRADKHSEYIELTLKVLNQQSDLAAFNARRTDAIERQMPNILAYETRFKRLEDAVFNKAG